MLQKNPSDRYDDCPQLIRDLQNPALLHSPSHSAGEFDVDDSRRSLKVQPNRSLILSGKLGFAALAILAFVSLVVWTVLPHSDVTLPATSGTLNFEDSQHFPEQLGVWNLTQCTSVDGLLMTHNKCSISPAPDPRQRGAGGSCLLLAGHADQMRYVEFRPNDLRRGLKSIRFQARRQSNTTPFSFEIQAKPYQQSARWKTIVDATSIIDSQSFQWIAIDSPQLDEVSAGKFRFKIESQPGNGVYIDNLTISLKNELAVK